jgi:glycosidase
LGELGVNALYLCPVFKSGSNHGYDTFDYMVVDPRFGSNDDLRELVADCHRRGIRVLLDLVLHHTGVEFFAFKDLQRRGPNSPYRDWFFPWRYPVEFSPKPTYRTFGGNPGMPELNLDNPGARRYFMEVAEYWMRFADVDGWRLDVADQVSEDFWRAFRRLVKSIRPDAYILGEVWKEPGEWLQGDQFDGVTNYRLRGVVLDYFAGKVKTAVDFENELRVIREEVRPSVVGSMYNLLESHDTPRVKTLLGAGSSLHAAIAFMFGYPGVPAVYYGTEIGMEGGEDPDCRRCMIWDEPVWDPEMLELHRRLIALRRGSVALRRGSYEPRASIAQPDLMAFERHAGDETVLAIFSRSSKTRQLKVGAEWRGADLAMGKGAFLERGVVNVDPYGFAFVQKVCNRDC